MVGVSAEDTGLGQQEAILPKVEMGPGHSWWACEAEAGRVPAAW